MIGDIPEKKTTCCSCGTQIWNSDPYTLNEFQIGKSISQDEGALNRSKLPMISPRGCRVRITCKGCNAAKVAPGDLCID